MTLAGAAIAHPESSGPIVIGDAARLPLSGGVADCAVAFMSLQDVDEMEGAMTELGRILSPGGRLVMAIVHPLNSGGRFGRAEGAETPPFVIEGSWYERRATADTCERDGLTMTFHSEHRPLHDYTDAVVDAGFVIERLREVGDPDPDDKWHRIPMFLHLRALRL